MFTALKGSFTLLTCLHFSCYSGLVNLLEVAWSCFRKHHYFITDLKLVQQSFFYDVIMLTCFTIPSGKCQSHGGTVSGICTE